MIKEVISNCFFKKKKKKRNCSTNKISYNQIKTTTPLSKVLKPMKKKARDLLSLLASATLCMPALLS